MNIFSKENVVCEMAAFFFQYVVMEVLVTLEYEVTFADL